MIDTREDNAMDTYTIEEIEYDEPAVSVTRLDGSREDVPGHRRRGFRIRSADGTVLHVTDYLSGAVAYLRGYQRCDHAAQAAVTSTCQVQL